MKILHVSLGNPDTHQGGLNRYCKDIIDNQRELGHQVYILYPGSFFQKKISIKKTSDFCYKISNALPVALIYGIDEPKKYFKKTDATYYKEWLKNLSPDIIHVHSIQGIHLEFFLQAKELGIKLIFTTHDYYPFCPKCVLYDMNGNLCEGFDATKCALCNQGCGLSEKKHFLMQSELYQKVKIQFQRTIKLIMQFQLKS